MSRFQFPYVSDAPIRGFVTAVVNAYIVPAQELGWRELLRLADTHFNNGFTDGTLTRPYLFDLLQLAHNLYIFECNRQDQDYSPLLKSVDQLECVFRCLEAETLRLPTHTFRDFDKVDYQQFSTPPAYALVALVAGNPQADDVFLEPSCGSGTFLSLVGPFVQSVTVNELDPERVKLLSHYPLLVKKTNLFQLDAGKLHVLPEILARPKPTLIVMNPPFSVDQGRKDPMVAARHVESALRLLAPGGRLVAILSGGQERNGDSSTSEGGMGLNTVAYGDFWRKIMLGYTVRCNLGIEGDIYAKYGTTVRTRLVVIDKIGPQGQVRALLSLEGQQPFVGSPSQLLHSRLFWHQVVNTRLLQPTAEQQAEIVRAMTEARQKASLRFAIRTQTQPAEPVKEPAAPEAEPLLTEQASQEHVSQVLNLMTRGLLEEENAGVVSVLQKHTLQREACAMKAAKIIYALRLQSLLYAYPADQGFYAKLERGEGLLPLTIERQGHELSFTHYFEQNGDLCRDSEVRFLAPEGGLLKLQGISGWGPRGEFEGGPDKSFASLMLQNVVHFLTEHDWHKLTFRSWDKVEMVNDEWGRVPEQPEAEAEAAPAPEQPAPATLDRQASAFALLDGLLAYQAPGKRVELREETSTGLILASAEDIEETKAYWRNKKLREQQGHMAPGYDICVERFYWEQYLRENGEFRRFIAPLFLKFGLLLPRGLDKDGAALELSEIRRNQLLRLLSFPLEQLQLHFQDEDGTLAIEMPDGKAVVYDYAEWHEMLSEPEVADLVPGMCAVLASQVCQVAAPLPAPEQNPQVLVVDAAQQAPAPEQDAMDVFHGYQPFVRVQGSHPHNVVLVESNAMRHTKPPLATTPVFLPRQAVEAGHISAAQLETVIYAVHAHSQILRDGVTRKGFLNGDGTGVGKGVQAAAIAMHYYYKLRGQLKVVWVTKEFSLAKDARRDWTFIGGQGDFVFTQDTQKQHQIKRSTGIMVTSYTTMSNRGNAEDERSVDRLAQLISWEPDLVIFDECHLMGNAVSSGGGARGAKKASQRGMAGVELQEQLPDVPFVFFSATSATEVHNLSYCGYRLGLFGPHVPAFPTVHDFVSRISKAGMLGMELVAKDMKALGVYLARNLSYEGTSFELLQHPLTGEQRALYDEACGFWRLVYERLQEGFEMNDTSSQGKAQIMGQFWGAAQRFFNQVLISMQTPTAIAHMLDNLRAGNAIVVQLVNTNEAATERVVGQALANEQSLDDLDITPRDCLMQFVELCFPTVQYEYYTDDNGNDKTRPMKDDNGNLVHNPEAVALRQELVLGIAEMRVPEGALDMVLQRMQDAGYPFAEITGRQRRFLVQPVEGVDGAHSRVQEKRTKAICDAEAQEFMDDKRQGLLFSDAGNTGRSFQADRRAKNQRRRIHYVLQPGWRADGALQGMGRTHRTNQASEPHYVLVTTDLPGQKRFVTSIARRIEQLGSLTKGNRKAANSGLFKDTDNLETEWAKTAINNIFRGMFQGKQEYQDAMLGLSFGELSEMMGLKMVDTRQDPPLLVQNKLPAVTTFLNRLLFVTTPVQDALFALFERVHHDTIEQARQLGQLDTGLEQIRAKVILHKGEQLVYADKDTGARTHVVQLECQHEVRKIGFAAAAAGNFLAAYHGGSGQHSGKFLYWCRNNLSRRVYGVWAAGHSLDLKSGDVIPMVRAVSPFGAERESVTAWKKHKIERLTAPVAQALWQKECEQAPLSKIENRYLVTGAVLPVWDKLGNSPARVMVASCQTGETVLGRYIPEGELNTILSNLGATNAGVRMSHEQMLAAVLEKAALLHLANGWYLERLRSPTGNGYRLRVHGPTRRTDMVGIEGLQAETLGSTLVAVLEQPRDNPEECLRLFTALLELRPAVRLSNGGVIVQLQNQELEQVRERAEQQQRIQAYNFDEFIEWQDTLEPLKVEKRNETVALSAQQTATVVEKQAPKTFQLPSVGLPFLAPLDMDEAEEARVRAQLAPARRLPSPVGQQSLLDLFS